MQPRQAHRAQSLGRGFALTDMRQSWLIVVTCRRAQSAASASRSSRVGATPNAESTVGGPRIQREPNRLTSSRQSHSSRGISGGHGGGPGIQTLEEISAHNGLTLVTS